MTVVIDASALVAALVDSGSEGEWAAGVTASGSLLAPEPVLVETANTLRRLEASDTITRLEATSAFRDLLRLDLELLPFAPFAERVWQLRGNLTCLRRVVCRHRGSLRVPARDSRPEAQPGRWADLPVPCATAHLN